MIFFARCLGCSPQVTRSFPDFDAQQDWIGPHLDITGHRIKSWESES